MIKFLVLLSLLSSAAPCIAQVEDPFRAQRETIDLPLPEPSWDPQEKRQELRELVSDGHGLTIRMLIKDLEANRSAAAILEDHVTVNRKALPYLFDALPAASMKSPPVTGDVILHPPRIQIALVILRVIERNHRFPEATQAWMESAKSGILFSTMGKPEDLEKFTLLQQWWNHNRSAILQDRVEQATWLPVTKQPNE